MLGLRTTQGNFEIKTEHIKDFNYLGEFKTSLVKNNKEKILSGYDFYHLAVLGHLSYSKMSRKELYELWKTN